MLTDYDLAQQAEERREARRASQYIHVGTRVAHRFYPLVGVVTQLAATGVAEKLYVQWESNDLYSNPCIELLSEVRRTPVQP